MQRIRQLISVPRYKPSNEEIQARAYEIWIAKGNLVGEDIANWLEAKRELENPRNWLTSKGKAGAKFISQTVPRFIFWDTPRFIFWDTPRFIFWDTPRWLILSLPKLEWVKLLAVPLVLGAAGGIITGQIQKEANQTDTLNQYFDQLEALVFEHKLLDENPDSGALIIVRARTLATLRILDRNRKHQLIDFLQSIGYLNSAVPEKEPIVSFANANLIEIDFNGANLKNFNFSSANFTDADLRNTNLSGANLSGTNLSGANLSGANLSDIDLSDIDLSGVLLKGTNLSGANLSGTDPSSTDLSGTNLSSANLSSANLSLTDLSLTDLSSANLSSANLSLTDLSLTDLSGAYLSSANLSDAQFWTDEQMGTAQLCDTQLPRGSQLDPNRDCKALGIDPESMP